VFRLPGPVVFWWAWLIFAVANLVDLVVRGRSHLSAVIAAVLVLATGIVYVAALRPRIVADDDGVTVRNPLRDHRVPWGSVAKVDLVGSVRVHCAWDATEPAESRRTKILISWAVHVSRRAGARTRRQVKQAAPSVWEMRAFSAPAYRAPVREAAPDARQQPGTASAERIARLLSERAAQACEQGTAAAAPTVSWNWQSAAAILLPAVALVMVILA